LNITVFNLEMPSVLVCQFFGPLFIKVFCGTFQFSSLT
jgi:hypothetical protein